MQGPRITLRSSCLQSKPFTDRTISPAPEAVCVLSGLSFLIGFLKFKFCSLTSQTDKLAYFCMNNKKVVWIEYSFQKSFIRPNCTHGINSFFQFLSSYFTMLTFIISYLSSGVLSATNFSSNPE